jgi:hypothetical protein
LTLQTPPRKYNLTSPKAIRLPAIRYKFLD